MNLLCGYRSGGSSKITLFKVGRWTSSASNTTTSLPMTILSANVRSFEKSADLYATAFDYDSSGKTTRDFFCTGAKQTAFGSASPYRSQANRYPSKCKPAVGWMRRKLVAPVCACYKLSEIDSSNLKPKSLYHPINIGSANESRRIAIYCWSVPLGSLSNTINHRSLRCLPG